MFWTEHNPKSDADKLRNDGRKNMRGTGFP